MANCAPVLFLNQQLESMCTNLITVAINVFANFQQFAIPVFYQKSRCHELKLGFSLPITVRFTREVRV